MRGITSILSKQFRRLALLGCSLVLLFLASLVASPVHSQSVIPVRDSTQAIAHPEQAVIAQAPNLAKAFQELGVDGSIIIYDKNRDRFYEHNPTRNATAFFPASTFKILNALISLETGVIRDDLAILTWDGVQREIPAWNRDTNLRQAFKDSTVWFYQVLARRNGHEQMQKFVEQANYGNRQIGTPDRIDHFWLEGPLQITPRQEIEFLQRLKRNDLPFSKRTIDLVKNIMIMEQTPDYILRGKTGWVTEISPGVGWLVGYLEQNNNVYFFAANIAMSTMEDAPKRLELTRRSFKALGLL
ncbi:class D beta-lactamase [Trichocoleus sp. FACHB-591]|uniref:class D beta-lactamase n=1 Tax=Trichocoleus sp. FACHB-591 TaxID=2692872 RepID=UPI0016823CCF|nr:class D beta-lactamase [Trichocoleus sp. FACHB-591]MBD2098398.1 class D beta-lactamase [Trichocoleus sp. FACHB-591]